MSESHASQTENHNPFADFYADAAERTAATGFPRGAAGANVLFDSSDVGKAVWQQDDDSIWILTAVTPTWVQISAPSGAAGGGLSGNYPNPDVKVSIGVAASDETTALTAGAGKVTFRMPHAMTLTEVRASLTTPQASGAIFTVDINEGGVSILSTKLTIDNTEDTSTTATTPAVISDAALADDAEITVDIDQIGDGTATGLKIWLIGTRS